MLRLSPMLALIFASQALAADPAPVPAPAPAATLPGTVVPSDIPLATPMPATMSAPIHVYPNVPTFTGACDSSCGTAGGIKARLMGLFGSSSCKTGTCSTGTCDTGTCTTGTCSKPHVALPIGHGELMGKVSSLPVPHLRKSESCSTGNCAPATCATGNCNASVHHTRWERFREWLCWQPSEGYRLPLMQPAPYHAPVLAYFRENKEPVYKTEAAPCQKPGCNSCAPGGIAPAGGMIQTGPYLGSSMPPLQAPAQMAPAAPVAPAAPAAPAPAPAPGKPITKKPAFEGTPGLTMSLRNGEVKTQNLLIRSPYDRFGGSPVTAALNNTTPISTVEAEKPQVKPVTFMGQEGAPQVPPSTQPFSKP